MAIIQKEIELAGAKGRTKEIAIFDSGASCSIVLRSVAERIGIITPCAESIFFETAKPEEKVESKEVVQLFFWIDGFRFSDEFFVVEELTDKVILGAATLQKWRMRLDFEHEEVVIDPKVTRLRLL